MSEATKLEIIISEIKHMPDFYQSEILDFVHFLKTKSKTQDTAIASESSLKKDWLRPEEDEAWKDL